MSCTDCGKTEEGCGCEQEALSISQVCNPVVCNVDECSETFNAGCILYNDEDIICDNTVIVTAGDTVAQAVANLTAYYCDRLRTGVAIMCGVDEVVPADTPLVSALQQLTAYVCSALNPIHPTATLAAYNSITGIGNGDTAQEYVLFTHTIPADTLTTNGDELEVYAHLSYSDNDLMTVAFKLSATEKYTETVQNSEGEDLFFKITIARIDQTNQLWTIEHLNKTTTGGEIIHTLTTHSTTFDLNTTSTFEISAENAAFGLNQLTLKKATLRRHNL